MPKKRRNEHVEKVVDLSASGPDGVFRVGEQDPTTGSVREIAEAYQEAVEGLEALERRRSSHWMSDIYPSRLYGGWWHPDGRWIDKPNRMALRMHEAAKAMFCPICEGQHKLVHLGQFPTDESEVFTCPQCEWEGTCRQVWTYRTVYMTSGNRAGKDFSGLAEFSSWIMGFRPWDGTLTAPIGGGRIWGMCCTTLKVAESIIVPYFEERCGGVGKNAPVLRRRVRTSSKTLSHWECHNGDQVFLFSKEQFRNAGTGVNPFEGHNFFGFYWSEPMPMGARVAVVRGLSTGRGAGWGRELVAATPVGDPYLFHSAYLAAANMGGDRREVFVIRGSIYDNPSLTKRQIEEFLADVPPEEREAREHGIYKHLSGRVFPEYSAIHEYDPDQFDPLREGGDPHSPKPSSAPVILAMDPHSRRPWFMVWVCVWPGPIYYVVREWPTGSFHKMKDSTGMGFQEYAQVIRDVESSIPGGSQRVLWREMDPNFGRVPIRKESGSTTIRRELKQAGLWFRDDVNDSLDAGHAMIHELLGYDQDEPVSEMNHPRLFISEECSNVRFAFRNYIWDNWQDSQTKGLKTVPQDLGKDPMDALRYALMRKPRFKEWANRGQDRELQKERMMARRKHLRVER